MQIPPYLYKKRKGVLPISWEKYHGLCKGLAVAIADYNPTILLGIARGGLYPAALISNILRKELYPIRLTRRSEDIVKYEHPIWLLKPPSTIYGLRILVVDEICDSGETLKMVKAQAQELGAGEIRTAVMYSHKHSQDIPDYIGLVTDELILNPWDREIYKEGKFIFHPEYVNVLEKQGMKADEALLIHTKPEKPIKS